MTPPPPFRGRLLQVAIESHRLPDGRSAEFEIVRHPGGAAVLPLLDDGRVVLLRQFRPAVGGWLVELPAGRLEAGEDPAVCAARELVEEAGFRAGRLEKLGTTFPTVGFCDEQIHLYAAGALTAVPRRPEHDEFIEVLLLPLAEALAMATDGRIRDAKTQLALLLHAHRSRAEAP